MFKQSRSNEYMKGVNPTSGEPEPMVVNAQGAAHVTAPVTVGTAAQLVTATGPLGPNDAGRLFYDTTEAIAGGIGWQVWNGDALVTDYTYVTQATLLSGEDQDNDVIKTESRFLYNHITTATTTDVSSTGAFLHAVVINGGTAGAVTVYNNTTGATTSPIAVIGAATAILPGGTKFYNCEMPNGIQVATAAATDVTVIYRVNG